MIICVSPPALSRLRPALRLAGSAQPIIGLQRCRVARAAARSRRGARRGAGFRSLARGPNCLDVSSDDSALRLDMIGDMAVCA